LTVSFLSVESLETIQSLNPWVKIPEDWKHSYPDEDTSSSSSTSSETFFPPNSAESRSFGSSGESGEGKERGKEPFFDHERMTNLSEQVESHVFLRCRVKNLGDRTVSQLSSHFYFLLSFYKCLGSHFRYPLTFEHFVLNSQRQTYKIVITRLDYFPNFSKPRAAEFWDLDQE
jgi:hypothetical protein